MASTIRFINTTSLRVDLLRRGPKGRERRVAGLRARQARAVDTKPGQRWVVRDRHSGSLVAEIAGSDRPQKLRITDKELRPDPSGKEVRVAFRNQTIYAVNVYAITAAGRQRLVTTLNPGERVVRKTRRFQPFRMRLPVSGRRLGVFVPNDKAKQTYSIKAGDRSTAGDTKTEIHFINETELPVEVLWVGYDGSQIPYITLQPGQSYIQETYATHPWIVRDPITGQQLGVTIATARPEHQIRVKAKSIRRPKQEVHVEFRNLTPIAVELQHPKGSRRGRAVTRLDAGASEVVAALPLRLWRIDASDSLGSYTPDRARHQIHEIRLSDTQAVDVEPPPVPRVRLPVSPTVATFDADVPDITKGEPTRVNLQWSVNGPFTSIELSGGPLDDPIPLVAPQGTYPIELDSGATFTLTVFNKAAITSTVLEIPAFDPVFEVPVKVSQLVAEGALPQYAVKDDVEAQAGDRLYLSDRVLGIFAVPFGLLSEIVALPRVIDNPTVEFQDGAPGIVGTPGREVDSDNMVVVPDHTKLVISGEVEYLGTPGVQATLELFLHRGRPQAAIRLELPDGGSDSTWGIHGVFPDIKVFDALRLADPVIIVTSIALPHDLHLPAKALRGYNVFGKLDFANADDEMLRAAGHMLGVGAIAVRGAVSLTKSQGKRCILSAAMSHDVMMHDGEDVEIRFVRSDVVLEAFSLHPEPKLTVGSDVLVTLTDRDGRGRPRNRTTLVFNGALVGDPKSIGFFFTMNGTGRSVAGELPTNVHASHDWVDPFGIKGLTLSQLSLEVGASYIPPWIDRAGFAAVATIADTIDGSIALQVDSNDADNFVLAGTLNEITLLQILQAMHPGVYGTFAGRLEGDRSGMRPFVDVAMRDVKLSIVPVATTIGGVRFEDEGVTLMGTLDAWGWEAYAFVNVHYKNGITVEADMDELVLAGGALRIEKSERDERPSTVQLFKQDDGTWRAEPVDLRGGPNLSAALTARPHLRLSASVTVLGLLSGDLRITTTRDGSLKFDIKTTLGFTYGRQTAGVTIDLGFTSKVMPASIGGTVFEGRGKLTFRMSFGTGPIEVPAIAAPIGLFPIPGLSGFMGITPKIKLADDIPLVDLRIHTGATMRFGPAGQFASTFIASFSFAGQELTTSLTLPTAPAKFDALAAKVAEHIKDNAAEIFADVIGDADDWAALVCGGDIVFNGDMTYALRGAFKLPSTDIIRIMKECGKSIETIAAGLVEFLGMGWDAIMQELEEAGFSPADIADGFRALGVVFEDFGEQLGVWLSESNLQPVGDWAIDLGTDIIDFFDEAAFGTKVEAPATGAAAKMPLPPGISGWKLIFNRITVLDEGKDPGSGLEVYGAMAFNTRGENVSIPRGTNEYLWNKRSGDNVEIQTGSSAWYNVEKYFYAPVSDAGVVADLYFRVVEHDVYLAFISDGIDDPLNVRTDVPGYQSGIMQASFYGNTITPGGSRSMTVDLADQERDHKVRLTFTLERMEETPDPRLGRLLTPEDLKELSKAAITASDDLLLRLPTDQAGFLPKGG